VASTCWSTNAGSLVARRKLEEVDSEFWEEVIRINLTTMDVRHPPGARSALVQAGASSIVNVASLAGPQRRAWRLVGLLERQGRSDSPGPARSPQSLVRTACGSTAWRRG